MSVLDFLHLGSSLSLRAFARLGSSVSLFGAGQLRFGDSKIQYSSSLPTASGGTASGLEVILGSTRALSASTVGGTLHGMWASDSIITSSDRRLKRDIEPVSVQLQREFAAAGRDLGADDSLGWLLRELRPVAYKFSRGPESKYTRYGFIADEVQALLPDLARELPSQPGSGTERFAGLVYTDLIAVLVAQLQAHEARFATHEARFETHEDRIARLEAQVRALEARCP
jgi:hypothetical protein